MTQSLSEHIAYFATLIEKETGIQYNIENAHMLDNRLKDIAKIVGYEDVNAFWSEVKISGLKTNERELVLDLATNNETSFFRDPEIFDFFRAEYLMKLTDPSTFIRIWCAACSTGQEPYTLSMVFAQMRDIGLPRSFELLATDFSERVLAQAKQGVYSQHEVQRGLSAGLLARFFDLIPQEASQQPKYKIKSELQQGLYFKRQNLLDPWQDKGPFHVIFCRNVLIYQDIESKKKIIARFVDALKPGGYLILGGAESLLGLSESFDMQLFGKACVYKLKSSVKDVV